MLLMNETRNAGVISTLEGCNQWHCEDEGGAHKLWACKRPLIHIRAGYHENSATSRTWAITGHFQRHQSDPQEVLCGTTAPADVVKVGLSSIVEAPGQ